MAELKTKATKKSVKQFIDAVPSKEKREDARATMKLMAEVTKQKPIMWGTSIVGFGKYHYKSERSSQEGDWPMIGFSPRAANLTLYVMNGANSYKDLLKKLGPHKTSVGCLYIKRLSDIDLSTLKALIKKSYTDMKKKYG